MKRSTHVLFLNGQMHARGNMEYLHQVITDYMLTMNGYGRDDFSFRITSYATARREHLAKQQKEEVREV